MKTYKVIEDKGEVYNPNQIITSDELIGDYLDICNDKEDADLIGWIIALQRQNTDKSIDEAIRFITDAWEITLEEIKNK